MNEQPVPERVTGRTRITTQLKSMRSRRPIGGVVGPAELIALVGSFFVLALVVVAYLYFLAPARSRLANLQLERSRLQTQLRTSQDVVRHGHTTGSAVQNIEQSLESFENNHLLNASRGRMSLYDSLNILIRKNGLRNTSGPTYTPLEAADKASTAGTKSTSAKWQSVYPGIAISVTVEGPYQNLRRFVREIESNKQFVIINSVELERSTETGSTPAADVTSASAPRNSLVSLRLEMATYFQRTTEAGSEQTGQN